MRRTWTLVALGAGAAWAALRRPFRILVEGESMLPTLSPGDQLLCVRGGRIRRGDVVVLRPPSHGFEMVKRVVGLPGEILTRDGREERLGPDEYLVVGDSPAGSTDGRSFGPIRRADIAGIVRFRYLPEPRRVGRSLVGNPVLPSSHRGYRVEMSEERGVRAPGPGARSPRSG